LAVFLFLFPFATRSICAVCAAFSVVAVAPGRHGRTRNDMDFSDQCRSPLTATIPKKPDSVSPRLLKFGPAPVLNPRSLCAHGTGLGGRLRADEEVPGRLECREVLRIPSCPEVRLERHVDALEIL
jgi:hypothetical protein